MKNKKQQLQKLKNERGLTLVELLAVIVILGIISTIAFVMIGNVIDNAKKDTQIANAQQLIASAKLYEATEGDIGTEGVTAEKLHDGGFIETIVDPWEKGSIDMEKASVKKEGEQYQVTLPSSKAGNNISDKSEEDLRSGDRDKIFGEE